LIAPVDLGGARRDLMGGEIMDGFAYSVGGLAEVEIENPLRVGDHGGTASGPMALVPPKALLFFENNHVTRRTN
jgi:hypothetical protein